jgi:hypothetical protein
MSHGGVEDPAQVAGRLFQLSGSFESARARSFRHALAGHPLLRLESLAQLAIRQPHEVRFQSGRVPIGTNMQTAPQQYATGLSLRETVEHLDTSGSFVQINRVESDSQYAPLVDEVLDAASRELSPADGAMAARFCSVFLSSPGSITPFHLDHEQNFLCQIRGSKVLRVWDPRDRSVVPEETLESFHAEYSWRDVRYCDEFLPRAQEYRLRSGDGVYMPMGAPHAVENGAEVSITVSFLFNTVAAQREARAHIWNHRLRRMGIAPAPVGRSPARDRLKAGVCAAVVRARSLWRGGPGPAY